MDRTIRILLVEDNPGDARLIEEMLRETNIGFELKCAGRLSTAREEIQKDGFGIILLDLGLPDSQGLVTLEKLNEIRPEAPIIVLTGLADEETGIQAVKGGAQDYLIKGQVEKNLLIRSIKYAIERRKTEAEREELIAELKEALDRVNLLSGMLPICASCKKIRDDRGYWNQIESYITEHSKAIFSHCLCPECAEKTMTEIDEFRTRRKADGSQA
ncbi:MAG: response regulator [Nitrospiraceae bacterium]|nr:response regulator [Nitrospiraceae bacterium]